MTNLFRYYQENLRTAIFLLKVIGKKSGKEEINFDEDSEFPTIITCDNDGNVEESVVKSAKLVTNDDGEKELMVLAQPYNNGESNDWVWVKTTECPYLSCQGVFEEIEFQVDKHFSDYLVK